MSDDINKPDGQQAPSAAPAPTDGMPQGTPEQWREEFKRVIAQRDELKAFKREQEAAAAKAREEELAKRGEFEKLSTELRSEVEKLKAEKDAVLKEAETREKRIALKAAAKEAGVRDFDDVARLIDLEGMKSDDIEAKVQELKKAKPYLFNEAAPGIATPPVGGKTGSSRADLLKDPIALSQLKRDNPAAYARVMSGT